MKYLIVIFILHLNFSLLLSEEAITEKFQTQIPSFPNDSQKVMFLNDRAWQISNENINEAKKLSEYALKISQKAGFRRGIADACFNLGYIYHTLGNYDNALKYYFIALNIHDSLGLGKSSATDMGSIGLTYKAIGNYEKALDYFFNAKEKFDKFNDSLESAAFMNDIGTVYRILKQFDKAKNILHVALARYKSSTDYYGAARVTNNLGLVYWDMGDMNKAETYLTYAYKINFLLNDKNQIAICANNLGGFYLDLFKNSEKRQSTNKKNENLKKSFDFLQIAIDTAKEYGFGSVLQDAYLNISQVFSQKKDFKKAFEYYQKSSELRDSIFSVDKATTIANLENKYKEEQQKRLAQEIAMKTAKETRYRNTLQYSGITIFLLILFIILFTVVKFRTSVKMVDAMVFITFLLFFEFINVLMDPYVDNYTNSIPLYKLLANAGLAVILSPFYEWFEKIIKRKVYRNYKIIE